MYKFLTCTPRTIINRPDNPYVQVSDLYTNRQTFFSTLATKNSCEHVYHKPRMYKFPTCTPTDKLSFLHSQLRIVASTSAINLVCTSFRLVHQQTNFLF